MFEISLLLQSAQARSVRLVQLIRRPAREPQALRRVRFNLRRDHVRRAPIVLVQAIVAIEEDDVVRASDARRLGLRAGRRRGFIAPVRRVRRVRRARARTVRVDTHGTRLREGGGGGRRAHACEGEGRDAGV